MTTQTTEVDRWEPVGEPPEPHFAWCPIRYDWFDPTPTPALRAIFKAHRDNEANKRSAALRAAAFALYSIMEREGMETLEKASAGELARAAVEEFERVMNGGKIHV